MASALPRRGICLRQVGGHPCGSCTCAGGLLPWLACPPVIGSGRLRQSIQKEKSRAFSTPRVQVHACVVCLPLPQFGLHTFPPIHPRPLRRTEKVPQQPRGPQKPSLERHAGHVMVTESQVPPGETSEQVPNQQPPTGSTLCSVPIPS